MTLYTERPSRGIPVRVGTARVVGVGGHSVRDSGLGHFSDSRDYKRFRSHSTTEGPGPGTVRVDLRLRTEVPVKVTPDRHSPDRPPRLYMTTRGSRGPSTSSLSPDCTVFYRKLTDSSRQASRGTPWAVTPSSP